MSHAANEQIEQVAFDRLWWIGLLALGISVLGNTFVGALGAVAFGVSPEAFPPFQWLRYTIFTLVSVLGAMGVFYLVAKTTKRPIRLYLIVALVVLLVSFIPNFVLMASGAPVGPVIILMVMHVITAAAVVGLIYRYAPADEASGV